MEMLNHPSIFVSAGLLVGLILGFVMRKRFIEGHRQNIREQGKQLIETAIVEAEQLKKEAQLQSKEEAYLVKQAVEEELKADRRELKDERQQLKKSRDQLKKEWESLDRKRSDLQSQESGLSKREHEIEDKHKEVDNLIGKQRYELSRISGISQDEAKKLLMESLESQARMDASKQLAKIENERKIKGRYKLGLRHPPSLKLQSSLKLRPDKMAWQARRPRLNPTKGGFATQNSTG